ncbi:unnamed protein product [Eruca vesicaria subsp. sativa]|uniref:S-protein homolog n=1 Tax=Eruca vesicaria subsp. sativa TaxID=29727 RepID=A0ABC8K2U7_ERUVS|nr:unnamed protein product [Eruca vesicaria subsp. sativa]CAH8358162.1 unnamed protein product [Eruca vesicaria subsp. sativa]
MAFSNKPHFILIFMVSCFILTLFVSALDVSNAVAEAPSPGSGGDGYLPLSKKHVIIHNVVNNKQTLNVHCKSSEDDLGLIHLPWNQTWGFRFRVNIWDTTKFVCNFTWYGGGSHNFDIFDVWRDDNEFGQTPVCSVCIWEVGRNNKDKAMCRIPRDGANPYCFKWDNN